MPNWIPLDRKAHAQSGWTSPANFKFAAGDPLAPVVAEEIPHLMADNVLAFTKQPDGSYLLVSVQSLQPGLNLYVDLEGRWLNKYVPAIYRGYPFKAIHTENEQLVICFAEDSEFVHSPAEAGDKAIFTEDGSFSSDFDRLVGFLTKVEMSRVLTQKVVDLLATYQLFVPWELKLSNALSGDDESKPVSGLFRIDEEQLRSLDGDALTQISAVGGFAIVYAHLLSQHQIQSFHQHYQRRHQEVEQAGKLNDSIDLDEVFGEKDSFIF